MTRHGMAILLVCALWPAWIGDAKAQTPSLLGSVEFKDLSLDAPPVWQRVLSLIDMDDGIAGLCDGETMACPTSATMAWRAMIESQRGARPFEQLRAANRFINQWAMPSGPAGDDRDDGRLLRLVSPQPTGKSIKLAIAKYLSLRQLGFGPEHLRIVTLKDHLRANDHSVLAVDIASTVYILDTYSAAILSEAKMGHYEPQISANEQGRWVHLQSPTLDIAGLAEPAA